MIGALYFGQYFSESVTLFLPSGEPEIVVLEMESEIAEVELEDGSSQIELGDNIIEAVT